MDIKHADTFNYYDMGALKQFEKQAGNNKDDLAVAARQLESVFLEMVLKSMREADESLKSELFESESEDMYKDMYDKQLVLSLSETQSIGLKDVILRQLQGQVKSDK